MYVYVCPNVWDREMTSHTGEKNISYVYVRKCMYMCVQMCEIERWRLLQVFTHMFSISHIALSHSLVWDSHTCMRRYHTFRSFIGLFCKRDVYLYETLSHFSRKCATHVLYLTHPSIYAYTHTYTNTHRYMYLVIHFNSTQMSWNCVIHVHD